MVDDFMMSEKTTEPNAFRLETLKRASGFPEST